VAITVVAAAAAGWASVGRLAGTGRAAAALRASGSLLLVAMLAAPWLVSRHEPLRRAAQEAEQRELTQTPGEYGMHIDDQRRAYLDARRDESRRGSVCDKRRFFVASRNDLPLGFQPAVHTSLVFDSRDAEFALGLVRRAPDPHTCSYVVVLATEWSRPFVQVVSRWLTPVDSTGPFQVFRVTRP
jgi:hypothetical protein